LPTELIELAAREGRPLHVASLEGRFRQAGVVEIGLVGDAAHPDGISYRTPSHSGWADVRWGVVDCPVATAIEDLAEGLARFDLLTRLHIAMTDMDLIATTARELARYRHPIGGDEEPVHSPYTLVEQAAEVGLVVMYARSFTGDAKLGDQWRPEDKGDRQLHRRLLDLRHQVHAHADFTDARTLVDTTSMLGGDGPPIYAEVRAQLSRQELTAIAELCERQFARFWTVTGELKLELGSPASI
jgi:hypothetical protein